MSQSFERAKSRLANIQAIQPLLSALRTMSLGSWQMANKRLAFVRDYEDHMTRVIHEILPSLDGQPTRRRLPFTSSSFEVDTIFLIIGSERGLCGKFNISLTENALTFIEQKGYASYQIWAMGSRLIRELERKNVHIAWRNPLPASGLTSYEEAYSLTQDWLEQFEGTYFNRLIVLYNQLERGTTYQFSHLNLLPYEIQLSPALNTSEQPWPPSIIDTEPKGIYNQIIQHFIAASFYQTLLKSAAAEHSARYHLMEEASDNAEEIVEELNRVINAERKRRITQEMQELAVSAGLLES